MRKAILSLIVFAGLLFFVLSTTPSSGIKDTPTPTTNQFNRTDYFPTGLQCEHAPNSVGGTWRTLTIGESAVSDIDAVFVDNSTFEHDLESQDFTFIDDDSWTRFTVNYCVVDNQIIVLQITEATSALRIEDFVLQYGIPDALAFDLDPTRRVIFWFEMGLAIEVYVNRSSQGFGRVTEIIYFPYQENVNYEEKWPYVFTIDYSPPYDNLTSIPQTLNPFEFNSMVATMTAEPSRTRTATPTATATS